MIFVAKWWIINDNASTVLDKMLVKSETENTLSWFEKKILKFFFNLTLCNWEAAFLGEFSIKMIILLQEFQDEGFA